MKILLVSSFLPYPLHSGGHIRLFNLLKGLFEKHEVTLICEKRNYQTNEDVKEVEKFCQRAITVDRKKQWSLENILKTGFSDKPFLITGHRSFDMKNKISNELSENKFDLIHVETFYVMQNLPKTSLPIVLTEHNIEYLVYKRYADRAPFFMKPFLKVDIAKLERIEKKAWEKATKLIAVSELEKSIMSKIRKDVVVVSNGVDINKFKVRSEKSDVGSSEKRILFIGEFKWLENRDAVEWMLKDIWPEIKLKVKSEKLKVDFRLWIVGRKIPDSIKKLTDDPTVIFDENAPSETELIYQKADVLLAPIRVGGGTSFKILEAMASGLPIVTTPLGNAIDAKENYEILVGNDALALAQKVTHVLKDKILYEKISKNAREMVEEKFNWEKIAQKLDSVYESIVGNH